MGPQSDEDVSQDYYYRLLEKALHYADRETDHQLNIIPAYKLAQDRSIHLLNGDIIDVFWMGTSQEWEAQFAAIKIPLLRGLLGYRTAIVRRDKLAELRVLSAEQLKKKVACQGSHWPDTRILEHNNFTVAPVARYDLMFEMVSHGRCDYFPRAIFEGYGELDTVQSTQPNLVMMDSIILHYDLPIYFFVKRGNTALQAQINEGLEAMIDSGEYERFMQEHPTTKHLYPLSKWRDKHIIRLDNPFASEELEPDNERYWIKL